MSLSTEASSNAVTPLAREVGETIRHVLGGPEGFVPLHEPRFAGREWDYVKECLDTGWVSTVGEFVNRFEKELAEFTGRKRVSQPARARPPTMFAWILPEPEPGKGTRS